MLYELRVYTALPGRMPDLLARFKDHTVSGDILVRVKIKDQPICLLQVIDG